MARNQCFQISLGDTSIFSFTVFITRVFLSQLLLSKGAQASLRGILQLCFSIWLHCSPLCWRLNLFTAQDLLLLLFLEFSLLQVPARDKDMVASSTQQLLVSNASTQPGCLH